MQRKGEIGRIVDKNMQLKVADNGNQILQNYCIALEDIVYWAQLSACACAPMVGAARK